MTLIRHFVFQKNKFSRLIKSKLAKIKLITNQ
jgi:hypothetical protein